MGEKDATTYGNQGRCLCDSWPISPPFVSSPFRRHSRQLSPISQRHSNHVRTTRLQIEMAFNLHPNLLSSNHIFTLVAY
jgi:hypothetical protein